MNSPENPSSHPKFLRLWPTQFMSMRLPGNENANPILKEFILSLDDKSSDMTVDYTAYNFFDLDHPAVKWLQQCCNRAILDYATELGIDYSLEWTLQGWANINRLGDYHNLHNHPHSWLSGTYYVSIPDQKIAPTHRSDLNPGAISFFDPRPQANMNAIKGDGQVDPEFRKLPANGELMIWPAFLHHLVHPNASEEARISVSFNVVLKWKPQYTPI